MPDKALLKAVDVTNVKKNVSVKSFTFHNYSSEVKWQSIYVHIENEGFKMQSMRQARKGWMKYVKERTGAVAGLATSTPNPPEGYSGFVFW